MTTRDRLDRIAVVIPLKRVAHAKQRLRDAGTADVDALVLRLACGVIEAARPRPIVVVTEDDDVAAFASSLELETLRTSARTLSGAVQDAYGALSDRFARLTIVHADLATPRGIGEFAPSSSVALVADHHGRGTTVLSLVTGLDFHFAYGPDSLARHVQEARRLGVDYSVIADSPWSHDVDEPSDIDYVSSPDATRGGPKTPSRGTSPERRTTS
jgi:2-phospho-L-lactate/phosphoenolpyruvate guanylyltransferase